MPVANQTLTGGSIVMVGVAVYPIPANDDSMRTIQLIISALADAVVESRGMNSKDSNKQKENSKISLNNQDEKSMTNNENLDNDSNKEEE